MSKIDKCQHSGRRIYFQAKYVYTGRNERNMRQADRQKGWLHQENNAVLFAKERVESFF